MWEGNFGAVPVVDDQGRAIAMVTDRDICIAAYTQGRSIWDIPVEVAMSKQLYSVKPTDSIAQVEQILQTQQVHRMPVVGGDGRVVGIVALQDIVREAVRQRHGMRKEVSDAQIGRMVAAIHVPASLQAQSPLEQTVTPAA